jgi:ribonuclease P protein component
VPPSPPPGPYGFGRDRRLRKHDEFVRAQRQGRRVNAPHFVLLVSARQAPGDDASPPSRLGLVVSRKVGPAVVRNRVKRLCRECFRTAPGLVPGGIDLVVIARPGAGDLTLADVRAEWQAVAGLLRKRAAESLAQSAARPHVGGTARKGDG